MKKHYDGKYEIQGRSIGIELSYVDLDIVITSAPSEVDKAALQSNSVVSNLMLEDFTPTYEWKLSKGWVEPDLQKANVYLSEAVKSEAEWKTSPLWIPDREAEQWDQTHPLEQIRWTRDKNKSTNKHYVNVVKALKWWRTLKLTSLKYPKGYPIEHMIGDCCPDGISSVAVGVSKTLQGIVDTYYLDYLLDRTPTLPDRGVPEHDVWKRVSVEDFKSFYDSVKEYSAIAKEALEAESLKDQVTKWRKIFGDKFPPYDDDDNEGSEKNSISPSGSYADSEFGYLALKKLVEITSLSSLDNTPSAYRTLVDYLSTAINNADTPKAIGLLILIENSDDLHGILVRKIVAPNSNLSIYGYLYYKELLQGGKIELAPVLNYSLLHGANANLVNTTNYQQYFELFDIINELNHANDVITRFLKLYHIIEYLAYRRELVELEDKARNNRTFIREIHSLTGKGDSSNKELQLLKRNFEKIFSTEIVAGNFNFAPLSAAESTFIRKYWGMNGFTNTEPSHIATLIYRIRNSIVHNKESEFHITTSNPDEYIDVINLIKKMIQILERQIFDKISVDDPEISYQSQYIELY